MEFFFDFVSPYAYFASAKIDELARRHGRTVTWKPTLIGVSILKVMGLKPLMETPLKSEYIRHDKPRMASLLGLAFVQRDMTGINSVAASRAFLFLSGRDAGMGKVFARATFERLWARGEDITRPQDVAAICESAGIPSAEVLSFISSDAARQMLNTAVEEALSRKVFGTPFFIVDGEPIWGVDRLWMLEHWLVHGSWLPGPDKPGDSS